MGRHGKKQGKGVRSPASRRGAAPSERPSGPLAGRGGAALVLMGALVLVLLAYGNAIHGQFVYDDQKQILLNPLIQEPRLLGKALVSDVWAFTGGEGKTWSNYWRPVFVAGLSLQYAWFGSDPVGWHATNIALHFLATALGFFVLRALGARPAACAVATWLFAVSPVHVESVTWISGSPDPMAASFLFAAYLCYLGARTRRRWGLRIAGLAAFAAALLAKEIAIVFPAIVLVSELALQERQEKRSGAVRAALFATVPYLGVAALYLAVRISLVGMQRITPPGAPGLDGVVWSAPSLLLFYLRHALFPFGLGPSYPFKPVTGAGVSASTFLLPLAVVLVMAAGAFFLCRRDRIYRLVLPWFIFPLIPVFDVRSFIPEDVAHDRYLYLPLFGALAFVTVAAAEAWARLRPGRTAAGEVGLAAVGLGLAALLVPVTRSYNRAWTDEVSLWERGVQTNPETAFPHAQLGEAYRREDRFPEARREFERALELNSGLTTAHVALAALAQKEGRYAEAEEHLKLVLAQYPDLSSALDMLGMVYWGEGKLDEAITVLEHARRVAPYQRGAFTVNIAVLQRLSGRSDLARRELESLGGDLGGTKDPEVMRAWWFLGELDREAGRKDEAIALYEKYLAATEAMEKPGVLALRKVVADTLQAVRAAR
ncbi:MAG TPA: tetratricopeptide repeat protein [Thermoanaerobaculia bacterium]|jgi:tetratricopeptide (TPR) repeat protein|nr:tetratricopeptide repeat protein [Thermoanaerobaculia bacterium]